MAAAAGAALLFQLSACGGTDGGGSGGRAGSGAGRIDRVEVVVMAASSLTDAVEAVDRHFDRIASAPGAGSGDNGSYLDNGGSGDNGSYLDNGGDWRGSSIPGPRPDIVAVTAGSSTLVAQLAAGAGADLLMTADALTMDRARADGSVRGAPRAVAANSLVLAAAPGNPGAIGGMADLARTDLLIGLCAPDVPCGALARRVLESARIGAEADTLEQNARALAAKIGMGELDGGLVYSTDAAALGLPVVEEPGLPTHVNRYYIASVDSEPAPAVQAVLDAFRPDGAGARALRRLGFAPP